jgi:hypothetical protein
MTKNRNGPAPPECLNKLTSLSLPRQLVDVSTLMTNDEAKTIMEETKQVDEKIASLRRKIAIEQREAQQRNRIQQIRDKHQNDRGRRTAAALSMVPQ